MTGGDVGCLCEAAVCAEYLSVYPSAVDVLVGKNHFSAIVGGVLFFRTFSIAILREMNRLSFFSQR